MVYQVFKTVRIPIVGCGGITKAEDAIEFSWRGRPQSEVGNREFCESARADGYNWKDRGFLRERKDTGYPGIDRGGAQVEFF